MIPQEERWIFFPTNTHRNRFQPTLPQEERPFWCIMFTRTLSISIHAPTRGATKDDRDQRRWKRISIHAPTRGATLAVIVVGCLCGRFQSTLPQEERHRLSIQSKYIDRFQSTLPQEERPKENKKSHIRFKISIHAPTRGATQARRHLNVVDLISIHAPTRGATAGRPHKIFTDAYFNPRSHKRSDGRGEGMKRTKLLFQSTLPQEERRRSTSWPTTCSIFQSTLPQEERQRQDQWRDCIGWNFNPRSHKRSDWQNAFWRPGYCEFQSTLPQEERPTSVSGLSITATFQSTLPQEERHLPAAADDNVCNFNPRSHKRSDSASRTPPHSTLHFNPRSHKRSDRDRPDSAWISVISIHAPTRGATRQGQRRDRISRNFNPRSHKRSDGP